MFGARLLVSQSFERSKRTAPVSMCVDSIRIYKTMSDTDFDIDAAMAEIPDGETAPAAVSSPIGGGHTPAPNDGVAAPTAPLVATHDARAEDAQDDPDAMVVISGNPTMRDADGKRITFEKKQIVLAYAPVACKAGINEIPDDGFGADAGWGNFYAYVSEADATKFTKECGGVLHARGHDGEMHALKVKACKIDYDAAPTLAKGLARSTVANMALPSHVTCAWQPHLS